MTRALHQIVGDRNTSQSNMDRRRIGNTLYSMTEYKIEAIFVTWLSEYIKSREFDLFSFLVIKNAKISSSLLQC